MSCLWGIPPTPVTEDECSTLWRSRGFQPSSFSLHKTTAWSQPPVTNCVPLLHGKNWMLLIIPLSWGLSFRNSTPAFWTCTGNRLRLRAIRKKITIRLHKWMQLHANWQEKSWKSHYGITFLEVLMMPTCGPPSALYTANKVSPRGCHAKSSGHLLVTDDWQSTVWLKLTPNLHKCPPIAWESSTDAWEMMFHLLHQHGNTRAILE